VIRRFIIVQVKLSSLWTHTFHRKWVQKRNMNVFWIRGIRHGRNSAVIMLNNRYLQQCTHDSFSRSLWATIKG
jgi:hypothetical protein